jgi:hypothetical protein
VPGTSTLADIDVPAGGSITVSTTGTTSLGTGTSALSVPGTSTLTTLKVPGTSTLPDIDVPAGGSITVATTGTTSLGSGTSALSVPGTSTLTTLAVGSGGITIPTSYSSPGNNLDNGSEYVHTSDRRLKTRLVNIDDALEKALKLKGVYFSWTKNAKIRNLSDTSSARRQIGFIAQDVMDIVPEAVSEIDDDGYLGVNYNALVSLLVEAMRELNEKVNHLQVELDKLNMISSNRDEEDVDH